MFKSSQCFAVGGSHANASYCGAEVVRKVEYSILTPSLVRNGRHLRHLEKQQCQSQEQVLEANGNRNYAQRVVDSFQEPERDQKRDTQLTLRESYQVDSPASVKNTKHPTAIQSMFKI